MTIQPAADSTTELHWFKSSHSSTDGPECVEVATTPGIIHVRDSKAPQGARLAFGRDEWSSFLSSINKSQ